MGDTAHEVLDHPPCAKCMEALEAAEFDDEPADRRGGRGHFAGLDVLPGDSHPSATRTYSAVAGRPP